MHVSTEDLRGVEGLILVLYSFYSPDDVKGFTLVDELKLFGDIPIAYLNTLDQ